jgi:hypothetical protein
MTSLEKVPYARRKIFSRKAQRRKALPRFQRVLFDAPLREKYFLTARPGF